MGRLEVRIVLKKLLIAGAAVASASAYAGFVSARTIWRSWGIDPREATRALPGDDLIAEPKASDTRGIDIAAPPEAVWPWLLQMGYGRAGWYSYDQMDMDHPSLDHLDTTLQALAVGDIVPTHPGGGFEVKILEANHALVVYSDRDLVNAQAAAKPDEGLESASANVRATAAYPDKAMTGDFAASWAFVIEPKPDGGTRLIERFRASMAAPQRPTGRPFAIPPLAFSMLGFGVFVMIRRQMLGIRDRAEGRPIKRARFPLVPPIAPKPA
jgi:hypothetical protein